MSYEHMEINGLMKRLEKKSKTWRSTTDINLGCEAFDTI